MLGMWLGRVLSEQTMNAETKKAGQSGPPKRHEWPYVVGSLLTFVLLGGCQIYWFAGSDLIASIQTAVPKVDKAFADAESNTGQNDAKPNPAQNTDLDERPADDQLIMALSTLNSYQDDLRDWFSRTQFLVKLIVPAAQFEELQKSDKANPYGEDERRSYEAAQRTLLGIDAKLPIGKAQSSTFRQLRALRDVEDTFVVEDLVTANFLQQTFQIFILPFLYGLLGAFINIIRKLSGQITTHGPEQQLWLGLPMGALSGVAVAWVFNPLTSGELTKSLQPFALAFIAGYSTDVLFSILDGLVEALVKSTTIPPRTPPAPGTAATISTSTASPPSTSTP